MIKTYVGYMFFKANFMPNAAGISEIKINEYFDPPNLL
jgi:hypothetical protein